MEKRVVLTALRMVLAVLLLAWLNSRVGWQGHETVDENGHRTVQIGMADSLRATSVSHLTMSVVCMVSAMAVAAMRWRLLLKTLDIHIGVGRALRWAFLAEFFSTFLPGRLGGDAAKLFYLARHSKRVAHAAASIIMDRMLGLCGMAAIGAAALVATWASGGVPPDALRAPLFSLAAVGMALGAAALLALAPGIADLAILRRIGNRLPLGEHLARAGEAFVLYRHDGTRLLQAAALTLLTHMLDIAAVLILGMGLGLKVDPQHYLVAVPLIMIITSVPLTPGAIGVMENLFILYFASAGAPRVVLALAIMVRLATFLCAAPGAVLAPFERVIPGTGRRARSK